VHTGDFFSLLHDLERSFFHFSFRTGSHAFSRVRSFWQKTSHTVFNKTPMRKISDAVSGRRETNGKETEPSAYLKDITDHRDQMRGNGQKE